MNFVASDNEQSLSSREPSPVKEEPVVTAVAKVKSKKVCYFSIEALIGLFDVCDMIFRVQTGWLRRSRKL